MPFSARGYDASKSPELATLAKAGQPTRYKGSFIGRERLRELDFHFPQRLTPSRTDSWALQHLIDRSECVLHSSSVGPRHPSDKTNRTHLLLKVFNHSIEPIARGVQPRKVWSPNRRPPKTKERRTELALASLALDPLE
jgi:hypothetical protein